MDLKIFDVLSRRRTIVYVIKKSVDMLLSRKYMFASSVPAFCSVSSTQSKNEALVLVPCMWLLECYSYLSNSNSYFGIA